MKKRNLLLTLGSLTTIAAPIAAVVSCGEVSEITQNNKNTLYIPKDFAIATNAEASNDSKLDLDDLLANSSKENALRDLKKLFAGEFSSVHLNANDFDLGGYGTNFELQLRLKECVYKLSQKFPTIIISTPSGQAVFSPDKIVNVKSLNDLSDDSYKSGITSEGGGQPILLADNFPKAPAHSWFTFKIDELTPEVPADMLNPNLDRILHRAVTAWPVTKFDGSKGLSIGQFVTPTELNKEITIHISLNTEDGYTPDAYFNKTFKFIVANAPASRLKEGIADKYFKNQIYSLSENIGLSHQKLLDIKKQIKDGVHHFVESQQYSFKGFSTSPNLPGFKTALKAAIDGDDGLIQFKTAYYEAAMVKSSITSAIDSITSISDGMNSLGENLVSKWMISNIGVDDFNKKVRDIGQHYIAGGDQGLSTPVPADPAHTGFHTESAFQAAIDAATNLQALKTITDKFKNDDNPVDALKAAFDYDGFLTKVDGVSTFADMKAKIEASTTIEQLKSLFGAINKDNQGHPINKLPAEVAGRSITLLPKP